MTMYPETPVSSSQDVLVRAHAIFKELYDKLARRTDRFFGYLMIAQWIFGIVCALIVSPRTWVGAESQIHVHVWAAVLFGGLISSFPAALAFLNPGKASTRHVVALGQMLMSALLIHLTAGRIETHFHVFGSLAFLAFYKDWRVLLTASIVVALDHFLRGVYWPQSVFGVSNAESWRWLEHTGWVVFEDIFLMMACVTGVKDMREDSERRAILEQSNLQIESLRQSAEEANAAKSAFLANMSHEMRTPLGAILGFSQLMCEDKLAQDTKAKYLEVIGRNGSALTKLIDDIIDLAKVEAGKIDVESVRFSLSSLLRDISESLTIRAEEKAVQLIVHCQLDLPDMIVSDPARIRQILLNVIGNAVKFTEKGFVRITVSGVIAGGRINLHFKVEDSGLGLTQAEQDKLFQPFSQADVSTTRRFGGTGLGLALSRKLANALGGDLILAASVPGKGSTFVVTIPAELSKSVKKKSSKTKSDVVTAALTGLKILVAEDAPDNQMLIEYYLTRAGAEVKIVDNGETAMKKALEGRFDVVLMDIQMPIMDGYIATETLRQKGYNRTIIALTAHAMVEDRAKCEAAGFSGYLTKPINAQSLVNTIASYSEPKSRSLLN